MLACVLALGAGTESLAQDASPPPSAQASSTFRVGAMLDVGAPDGIGVSAVVRPIEWLRLNAGITTNTLSLGVRGGITLAPLATFVTPTVNADIGHYFDASYNKLVDRLGGIPLQTQVPIDDVGFNYMGASVGLEIGKPDSFLFSLRLGFTHGSLTIDDAQALLQDVTGDPDITAEPLDVRFTSPSIKLGFLLYFL